VAVPGGSAQSREQDRTLKLFFAHTGEKGEFTFKRGGRYDRGELARINKFLRDWRRNEPAQMDPKLLDLVWAIYKQSGSRDYIHVVSAYRSLATNNMLRSRSRGVAEKSQHTLGKAMDWYVTDVPLAKLRAVAMKLQGGGVGYYPTSGSPFVHTDTGNVRAWPRMSRSQLIALFPNGETLHLPADGKPLPGYQRALAARKSSGGTALAYLETGDEAGGGNDGKGWLKRLFDDSADQAEDDGAAATAAAPAPKPMRGEPPQLAPANPANPAAPEIPAAPAAPAVGEPQVLIASTGDTPAEARLPKARPATETDMMLASLAPDLPAQSAIGPEDGTAVASLAFAPLPRGRPDAALLAGSLQEGRGADALAVAAEDAIAALSIQTEGSTSAPEQATAVPVQVAVSSPAADAPPVSDADRAILAGFAAIEDMDVTPVSATVASAASAIAAVDALGGPDAAPVPRPRPVAVAFTGAGLSTDVEVADAAPPVAAAPAPAAASEAAPIQIAAAPAAEPAYGDQDALAELIAMPAATDGSAGFAMPQPAGAPGLFSIPASAATLASAVTEPSLPTDRFEVVASADAPADESFISRLFASLAR
jgi:uncharacterized protein YcbK (DUF882 family)